MIDCKSIYSIYPGIFGKGYSYVVRVTGYIDLRELRVVAF